MLPVGMGTVTVVGGALAAALCLIRWKVSRKWGYFTSTRKLNGQVIIITGANVGLGLETARDLAARGATIVLACRNWDATSGVMTQLRKSSGNHDIQFIKLDLSSLKSIREFSEDFLEKYSRLDTLILNAGVWVPMEKKIKTADGFEIHAGVNHLGHFYLTNLLLDLLKKTEGSRVVTVSSSLMRSGRLEFDTCDQFHQGRPAEKKGGFAPTGYCDSKLMNALFTKELAGRTGLTAVCCCPGFCYTQLSRNVNMPTYKKILFLPIMFLFMRSAARGAHNTIHAAVETTDKLTNGGFYRECCLSDVDETRLNNMVEERKQLWDKSKELCNLGASEEET